MAKGKNIPCPAGCSGGLKMEKRPVTRVEDGKKITEDEWCEVECKACDGSGYIHVPGGE